MTILLLVLLSVLSVTNSSPQDRCDALSGSQQYVCDDCGNQYACLPGPDIQIGDTFKCISGQICDLQVEDGACQVVSSSQSPICFCAEVGCFTDPNNEGKHVKCSTVDSTPTIVNPCSEGQLLDLETCSCSSTVTCPSCDFTKGDTLDCGISYYYCGKSEVGTTFNCDTNNNFCFNENSCRCEVAVDTAGCVDAACGLIPDANNPGTGFIDCTSLERSKCPSGQSFNSSTCECFGGSCTANPGTGTGPGSSSCTEDCNYAPEGQTECAGYVECDESGNIINVAYECPPGLCFDQSICNCS